MINKRNDLGQIVLNEDDDIKQRVELKYSKYEYVGGYTGTDGYLYLRCKDCGRTKKYNAQIIRPSRHKYINCPVCNAIAKQYVKDVQKEKNKLKRQEHKLLSIKPKQMAMTSCPVCLKMFVGNNKYCSFECANYVNRKHHDDRRIRRLSNKGDNTISLRGLISRQGKRCAICGEPIDMHDYEIRGQVFIAGNNYPSIDHIVPLAKGGAHQWDNVQVAHRICNSRKNDKIV